MNKDNVKSVIISVFFSELIALFSLAVFTFFTYNKPDPSVYSSKLGVVSLLIGGLVCGIISSLMTKQKTLSIPIFSGGAYCLLQLITSIIFSNGKFDFILVLVKLILTMGICFIISYSIVNKNTKYKNRRKRLRNK